MRLPTCSVVRPRVVPLDAVPPLTAVRAIRPHRLPWATTSATPRMHAAPVSTTARPNDRFDGRTADICSGEGMRWIRLTGSSLYRRDIADLLDGTPPLGARTLVEPCQRSPLEGWTAPALGCRTRWESGCCLLLPEKRVNVFHPTRAPMGEEADALTGSPCPDDSRRPLITNDAARSGSRSKN
jgi:hypothetical protein